jgi:hypothetical protein
MSIFFPLCDYFVRLHLTFISLLFQGIETDITEAVETGIESMSISDDQLAARAQEDEEEEGRGHVEGQEEI